MIKLAAIALCVCAGAAQADDAALMAYFETEACAIGGPSVARAQAAGFSSKDIDRLSTSLGDAGHLRADGDWSVIAPEVCTIRFPDIDSPFAIDDPVVIAATSDVDAYSAPSEITGTSFPGCYLNGDVIQDALDDAEDRTASYFAFLGAGIVSGNLRFYNESILETPPGFQLTRGPECDSVPNIAVLTESHDALLTDLDAFIRDVGVKTSCDNGLWPIDTDTFDVIAAYHDTQTNAHFTFEIAIVAAAAGWFEGAGDAGRGVPRPPFCTAG